jgi:predicted CXXCH cytochrome family protein
MRPQRVSFLLAYALALLLFLVSPAVYAKVTGPCANCHTMHNSQGGSDLLSEPQPVLLVNDCLGCHSASDGSTWKDDVTGAPIVYNTNAPQYGYFDGTYYHGLAGGNFYWVKTDDSKGHNVFPGEGDNTLTFAPGGFRCFTNACHDNFHVKYTDEVDVGLDGRQGCTGCHMLDDDNQPKGFHHANDGDPGNVINAFPWYRFLKGHNRANDGGGVSGIEDSDWQVTLGPGDHNEYLGESQEGGNTSDSWSLLSHHTMTAFCSGCHGQFHIQQEESSDAWIRHPSDKEIPNSGEYIGYTIYDPDVPVARQTLTTVSSSVTPGTDGDLVMCLSCHRPHGSPYPDMLRWNYDDMEVGSGGSGGCFTCHTQKN